ncbi:hypothetical protein HYH03_003915 [Edaphochlamys debaryana]|uniref:Uncharacterized protein n=1 Tax=Edaphochlamys debaryana TaxID=47281 RepID=A0A835YBC3_9CHLO|nr:hypothetical protein HYH03_003915 [Edaphochlamys debaryana]|eukprot:KAG2498158.1 hypothetical protein HYH03_003915 [Edaphochlamys debaryana]
MAPRAPPLAPAQESPFSTHGASAPLQAHPPPPRRDSFQRPAPPARGRALTRSACSSFSYPEHPFAGSQAPGPPGPPDGSCNAPRAGPQPASGGHAWEGWSTEPQPQQQPQPPSQPNPHRPPPRRGGVGSWEDAARPHSPLYTVSPLADHADLSADYEAYEAPLSAEIGGRPSDEAGEGTESGGSASELRGRSGAPHGPLPEPRSRSITRLPPLHFTPHGGIPTGVQHGPLASEVLSGTIVCSPVSAAGSVSGGVIAADRLFGARSTHSTGGAGPQSPCELEPTLHPLAQRRTSVSILDVARPQNARGFLPVGFRSLAGHRSPPAPHLPDPQTSAPFAEPHTHRDTTRPDHNTHQAPVPAPTSSLFSDLDKLRQLEALLDADGNPTGADDIEPAPVPSAPRRPLWPVRLPSITRTAHVPSGYAVSALRSGEPLADALGQGHAPGHGHGCGYGLGARGEEEGLLPGGGDEAARIAEAAARAGGFRTERSRRRGSC